MIFRFLEGRAAGSHGFPDHLIHFGPAAASEAIQNGDSWWFWI
jgi:hypothetical protein